MLTQTNPSLSTIAAILPDGFVVPYVEVALTGEAQRVGLSGRGSVGLDQGMLFTFGRRGMHSMTMRGCLVGLDMIWLDEFKRVRRVVTAPASYMWDEACASFYVLELAAGQASAHGIVPGSQIRFTVTP